MGATNFASSPLLLLSLLGLSFVFHNSFVDASPTENSEASFAAVDNNNNNVDVSANASVEAIESSVSTRLRPYEMALRQLEEDELEVEMRRTKGKKKGKAKGKPEESRQVSKAWSRVMNTQT